MSTIQAFWSPKVNFQNKWKTILSYRIIRIKRIFFGVYWCITWTKSLTSLHNICLLVNWSRLYINKLRTNAFNPILTLFSRNLQNDCQLFLSLFNVCIFFSFHICFENLPLGIPSKHTYSIHSIDVCRPWITKCTNLVFLHW
jgi:hypothetical protein